MKLASLFLAFAAAGFCQLADNTLTVPATRNVNLTPDQVSVTVYVDTLDTAGLDDVIKAVPGAGLSAGNLTSVSGGSDGISGFLLSQAGLEWQFVATVPFSQLPAVLASLQSAQNKTAGARPGTALVSGITFSAAADQTSTQSASASCSTAALLADARAEASKIADAAGVALTGLVKITDSYSTNSANSTIALTGYVLSPLRISDFLAAAPTATCGLTAQFGIAP